MLGAALGAQLDVVGLWITGGYAPVLVFGNKYDELRTFTADYYGSGQVAADVTLMLLHPTPKLDAGLLFGYRYNSVLAHGIGFGGIAILDFSPTLAGFLLVEPEVFPDAQSQINAAGYPSDRAASLRRSRAAPASASSSTRDRYFHLMLQPTQGACAPSTLFPAAIASTAARRSRPVTGFPFEGRLSSSCPW